MPQDEDEDVERGSESGDESPSENGSDPETGSPEQRSDDAEESHDAQDMEITLGPCHYDFDEQASKVAVRNDGSGWIPVCDDHEDKAREDGYEVQDSEPASDRS